VRFHEHPGGTNIKLERISVTQASQVTNRWFRVVSREMPHRLTQGGDHEANNHPDPTTEPPRCMDKAWQPDVDEKGEERRGSGTDPANVGPKAPGQQSDTGWP
jgi:hypothetical protein